MSENKKLTPLKFLTDTMEMPWGRVEYLLADLGFVDSMAAEGWLGGNNLSDLMQTYLERLVGETSFDWYGTQFPVLVKRLKIEGRTSLHVNPADEDAEQRYDAFGKTALWYVQEAGPKAKLFLGFKKAVSAADFYKACLDGTVEDLLHVVRPKAGESYLITPGMVHAAQDVTLLEIAEASELWFRLHDWDREGREIHLEEAFDLVDMGQWKKQSPKEGDTLAAEDHFTVNKIALDQPLKSHRDEEDTFLLYYCLNGSAVLQADKVNYNVKAGELILVPAEVGDFFLMPAESATVLLEVRMDPREDNDIVSEEAE